MELHCKGETNKYYLQRTHYTYILFSIKYIPRKICIGRLSIANIHKTDMVFLNHHAVIVWVTVEAIWDQTTVTL